MPPDKSDLIPNTFRERVMAALLRFGARLALRPGLAPRVSIARQRRWFKLVMRAIRPNSPARSEGGAVAGVAGEWTRPAAGETSHATILYLHGGAYCIGSAKTHRAVTAALAQATGLAVFAADYCLAPEAAFPAAVDDAFGAYRALSETGPVVIAGDSAGGGLTLAVALSARERGVAAPKALVLFAPWVDLTPAGIPERAPDAEVILSTSWIKLCTRSYLGGADAATPLASPLFADLAGLPPVLIQSGTDDILHGQALRLDAALRKANVTVRCEVVPDRWHAFQMLAGVLPSADAAIARAADFIRGHVAR